MSQQAHWTGGHRLSETALDAMVLQAALGTRCTSPASALHLLTGHTVDTRAFLCPCAHMLTNTDTACSACSQCAHLQRDATKLHTSNTPATAGWKIGVRSGTHTSRCGGTAPSATTMTRTCGPTTTGWTSRSELALGRHVLWLVKAQQQQLAGPVWLKWLLVYSFGWSMHCVMVASDVYALPGT